MNTQAKLIRHHHAEQIVNLAKWRHWFSDPEPTPTPEPPVKPGKKTEPTPAPDEPTFKQADIDRIIADRLKRADGVAVNEFLKGLGFEKADDLKALVDEAKARKDKDLSEAQKLQKQLDELKAKHDDALKLAESEKAARLLDKRDNLIKSQLQAAKAANPENILILMNAKKPDLVKAILKEDGEMDDKALAKFMETAKADYKTEFAAIGPGSPSNKDGRPPLPSDKVDLRRKIQF